MHRIFTLSNGIPLVMERVPGVRSVAAGIWFRRGSRHESDDTAGITHLTEHMFFQGSRRKSSVELARRIDILGGQFDAGTSKEYLCLTSKFLDEKTDQALELLHEMLFEPAFPATELEKEKSVILEEIKMYMDEPEEQVNEKLLDVCWNGNPLSRPILGDPDFISRSNQTTLKMFHSALINPSNMVVAVAGNIDFDEIHTLVERRFGRHPAQDPAPLPATPGFRTNMALVAKPLEQVYFSIGIPWHPADDPDRFTGYLINLILGGNVSSRLFQKLREGYGLTYSVLSYEASFSDCGMLIIDSSTGIDKFKQAVGLVLESLEELGSGDVSIRELDTAKTCMKSSVVMAHESSERRMGSLAKQYMMLGEPIALEHILTRTDAVELNHLKSVCTDRLNAAKSLVAVGNFKRNIALGQPLTRRSLAEL